MKKQRPEGWLDCAVAVLGIVMIVALAMVILILWLMKMDERTEPVVIEVKPITFEEQLKLDMNLKFAEWIENSEEVKEESKYLIEVTDEEIDLMARVVMSEASVLSFEAKQAIAQTIVNRVRTTYREFRNQNTVTEVINYPNAYSTQDNGKPNEECYEAVYAALEVEGFPTDMFWFREGKYHRFAEPFCQIGTTYFTTLEKY